MALDKNEDYVKAKLSRAVEEHRVFAREVEDQGSGNLTLNHPPEEHRSTNHRYGLNCDHDSSMRTSSRRSRDGAKVGNIVSFSTFASAALDARAPNQSCGLACADQGHPRAALDANDVRLRCGPSVEFELFTNGA